MFIQTKYTRHHLNDILPLKLYIGESRRDRNLTKTMKLVVILIL